MMKKMSKMTCFTAVAALAGLALVASPANAQEDESLGLTFDAAYASQYIWRGFDVFNDKPAFQPSLDYDLSGLGLEGFGLNVWGSFPLGSDGDPGAGINDLAELDYTLSYGVTLFEDEAYALDLGANYIYYHFPKLNHLADTQEIGVSVAMPSLINVADVAIVPSYYCGKLWPTSSGVEGVAGWYHEFGLGADLPVTKEIDLSLSSALAYNAGMFTEEEAFSHAVFGIGTSIPVGPVSVKPFIDYQVSLEDEIDGISDEFWGGLSVSYAF